MRYVLAGVLMLALVPTFTMAQTQSNDDGAAGLRKDIQELENRLDKVERTCAMDRIRFSGDFRFEAHSIQASIPDHYDGMMLQNGLVNTIFYYGATGQLPSSPSAVNQFIGQHYADYLYFTNNLTFNQLKGYMGMFPAAMQQQLMGSLMPGAFVKGYDVNNSMMYTSRLRLSMSADVAENVSFGGRLAMYKVWGDSTGVQVFNGQANTFNIDGTTTTVPNSDILRVERAYFDWKDVGGLPMYISIGRRPSTGGPPMNLRQDELRGGTPMGSLIDFQFDGITIGYHLFEQSTLRLCYGRGYESGFGNGEVLQQPADRLKDADFLGVNWDIWSNDSMLVQTTIAKAFNLTDGFNGLLLLPNNPLTGAPITAPFGGLFCDPFETPEPHSGTMVYVGGRYTLPNEKTMIGLEYNQGSKYWFNFTPSQDDIIAPKTDTRGKVVEAYVIHHIAQKFLVKLAYINYTYDYSGSGWQIGAPKKLNSTPVLGFPTYDKAQMLTLSMTARF